MNAHISHDWRFAPISRRSAALVAALVVAACLSAASDARALTPESPEVKQVIAKGIKYLESAKTGNWEKHPGMQSLIGMCILKQYGENGKNHPKVTEAIAVIRACVKENRVRCEEEIYDIGITLLFLLDLEMAHAGDFKPEMEALLNILLSAQKPHGGFGYPSKPTGDTSMTQYGALGMWACQMVGLAVPVENWERLINWLLRTQDPSGGYGYQGVDPGSFTLTKQEAVRQSMTAAALGSLTICAVSTRLFAEKEAATGPTQLKKVVKQESLAKSIDLNLVSEALRRGQGWVASHYTPNYKVDLDPTGNLWTYYYMYAFERYKSFLAELPGAPKDDNKWYDDGYAHLAKVQGKDGSWEATQYEMTAPNTAFALLFLFRSTQKIISHAKAFGGGLLVGGRGLPENASDLELVQGSLRAKALKGPAMELLQKLADPNDPKFEEAVRGMEEQSLVEEGDRQTELQKRLRKMAEGQSPEARAAALKLLGRTRNLDNVPLLVESLRDKDPQIFLAATDALRFIARKFPPAGQFGGADAEAQKAAIQYWKAWYRDIRPDAEFDDDN
ncbi:MAG TPA: hypothetical protein VFI31_10060 [Pirellulales bacterium]|nr:hypothetical protein [Pirellulales bacterium]